MPRLRLRPLNRHLVPDAQTSDRGPSASSPKLRFARVLLCPSPVARPRVIPAAAPCTDLDLHFAVAHRSRLRLRLRLLASSSTHLATLCPRAHLASSHRPSCVLRLPRLRLPPQPTVKSRGCPTLRPALRPPSPPALRSPALFQLRTTLISAPRSGAKLAELRQPQTFSRQQAQRPVSISKTGRVAWMVDIDTCCRPRCTSSALSSHTAGPTVIGRRVPADLADVRLAASTCLPLGLCTGRLGHCAPALDLRSPRAARRLGASAPRRAHSASSACLVSSPAPHGAPVAVLRCPPPPPNSSRSAATSPPLCSSLGLRMASAAVRPSPLPF